MVSKPSRQSATATLPCILAFQVDGGLDAWSDAGYLSVLMGQVYDRKAWNPVKIAMPMSYKFTQDYGPERVLNGNRLLKAGMVGLCTTCD